MHFLAEAAKGAGGLGDAGSMQKISIYDMDRTITVRGTYTPFLLHMVFARAPWRLIFLPLLPFGFVAYGLKLISRKALKTFNQRLLLGSRPDLARNCSPHIENYAVTRLTCKTTIYSESAWSRLQPIRKEGRRLVLATASYELYVQCDCEPRQGFDDVIGTRLEIE